MLRDLFGNKKTNGFCIKENYKANLSPSYYYDAEDNFIYQPDVYELAYYLADRADIKYIIDIGSGNGIKLKKFENKIKIICVDMGKNCDLIKKNINLYKFIEANLENGLPYIEEDIYDHSIVIMSDVIEHIINPDKVLNDLARISTKCKFMILSTPDRAKVRGVGDFGPPANKCHVREWNIEEFHNLLTSYKFHDFMLGFTINTDYHLQKNNIIALSGTYVYSKSNKRVRVLAILNVFNEADIIEEVANYIINQGIDVRIVDNWSNDGTFEKVKQLCNMFPQNIFLERFPENEPKYYEWEKLLKNTEKIGSDSDYDWIMHYDADEFRESPWKDVNLVDAISYIDKMGFNAIDFTVLDFRPTGISPVNYKDTRESMKYFEFGKRPGHFIQVKCWKNIKYKVKDLSSTGGHEIIFDGRKIYPIKFINRHYPLRNQQQAAKKIFKERIERFSPEEKNIKGWHTQYDNYTTDDTFQWDKQMLINWNRNEFDIEYFVERISGIGINK